MGRRSLRYYEKYSLMYYVDSYMLRTWTPLKLAMPQLTPPTPPQNHKEKKIYNPEKVGQNSCMLECRPKWTFFCRPKWSWTLYLAPSTSLPCRIPICGGAREHVSKRSPANHLPCRNTRTLVCIYIYPGHSWTIQIQMMKFLRGYGMLWALIILWFTATELLKPLKLWETTTVAFFLWSVGIPIMDYEYYYNTQYIGLVCICI